MAQLRKDARPNWVPTKRRVIVHVNHCLMLWYMGIVCVSLGVRIDTIQSNRIEAHDIRDIVIYSLIFIAWMYGTFWLYRWAELPPSRKAKMGEWRQLLTALTNGFESKPTRRRMFTSLITSGPDQTYFYPRFTAPGLEFGNLRYRKHRSGSWHYLAVELPVQLPHFILETTAPSSALRDLPITIDRQQRLSLEGDFDRWFRLYVPEEYERDALFVITPDVMASLVDHAHRFNVEIIGDRMVFFAPTEMDFLQAQSWLAIESLIVGAQPVIANATRYRDERVDEQNVSRTIESIRASFETPGTGWAEPTPRIGPKGQKLEMKDRRAGVWSVLWVAGWLVALTFLYVVPASFAFAGFMSIIDGR